LALAAKYKRHGSLHRALPMWEQAASLSEASRLPRLEAHLELAIHYEHRIKDYGSALRYAEVALELARRRSALARISAAGKQERERLERRINRLKRKLQREHGPPVTGRCSERI
jgi:tetratricopeptide (TPR) repeat protein